MQYWSRNGSWFSVNRYYTVKEEEFNYELRETLKRLPLDQTKVFADLGQKCAHIFELMK